MDRHAERDIPLFERSEPSQRASETFDEFYVREFWAVVGLAYALSGSRSGAEDLAQEAFLAAHRSWDRVGGFADPGAWVRRVVANRSVSAFRRRLTEAKALARVAMGSVTVLPELPDDATEVWSTVRALPRRQRQVIALHYVDDMSVVEIARVLGMAEGTVKRYLHEGRAALARRLGLQEGPS
jgi:RNA polymerase sigma-70 factor (sigma-E family)